jgi:hypothetical protein
MWATLNFIDTFGVPSLAGDGSFFIIFFEIVFIRAKAQNA